MEFVRLLWVHPRIWPFKDNCYWDNMIHPDDLSILYSNTLQCYFFWVDRTDENYVIIKQNQHLLRVKPTAIQSILYEGFFLDDKVRVISKEGANSERTGFIKDMGFHYKAGRLFYYIIDLSGKKIKKRYFSDDLEKAFD